MGATPAWGKGGWLGSQTNAGGAGRTGGVRRLRGGFLGRFGGGGRCGVGSFEPFHPPSQPNVGFVCFAHIPKIELNPYFELFPFLSSGKGDCRNNRASISIL